MTARHLISLVDIRHQVRDRRRALGLTQAGLASMAGVSRKWLVDLENGEGSVRVDTLMSLLDALGLALTIEPKPVSAEVFDVLFEQLGESGGPDT